MKYFSFIFLFLLKIIILIIFCEKREIFKNGLNKIDKCNIEKKKYIYIYSKLLLQVFLLLIKMVLFYCEIYNI